MDRRESVRSQGLLSGHSVARGGARLNGSTFYKPRRQSPVILLRRAWLDRRSALTAEGRLRSTT